MLSRRTAAGLFLLTYLLMPIVTRWATNSGVYGVGVDLVFALIALSLLFLWYRADRAELGLPISAVQDGLFVLIAALALPSYLIRSRGWTRGLAYLALGTAATFSALALGETIAFWLFSDAAAEVLA